ncbi:hypothetical protein IQ259_13055 [Fortiea sp. LEGE XX443]|uniref:hypothetical protein n=1 Tax=Fortiea sp. LEGE XX443 TaxID=1828611 RepID=UPI001881A8B6|nr:hypothetical protein [Fortiea sp. LEGE XX443]MBE9005951.1 hypothetical protein [Fortiea sp. LEGE XX443]
MQYQEPGDEQVNKDKPELEIVPESGGALVSSSPPSALERLNQLISQKQSLDEIRELLELKEIALKQQWQQNQIEEIKKRQNYERLTQTRKEITITVTSSVTGAIGLGIMYSSYPLVGTFVLLLGLATLLRIPFDQLSNEFLEFIDKVSDKFTSIFHPKS